MTSRPYLLSALFILAAFSIATWTRALIYESEITLWSATSHSSPNKARTHNNYGHALKEAHRMDEALTEFERALNLKPDYPDALNNLATIFISRGRKPEGLLLLNKALALDPGHVQAHHNLAMYYYESNLLEDAFREYSEIERIAPDSKEAAFGAKMLMMIRRRTQ